MWPFRFDAQRPGEGSVRSVVTAPVLIAAIWLFGAARALAGDGGGTSETAQNFLNGVCGQFGISAANCPQLPTLNQAVVEAAALSGQTPNVIRGPGNLNLGTPPGTVFDAGTLAGLTNPLAFIASPGQQPIPTNPGNPAANSLLSAVTSTANGNPTMLDLTFDFKPRTNAMFTAGQEVGNIILPLVVADGGQNPVRAVTATLNIIGTGAGSGITTDIVGDFLGTGDQTDQLSALGMTASLNFTNGYLEFNLGVPLLITSDVAPAYLFSAAGYEFDPTSGLFDGINPIAMFQYASLANNAGDLLSAVEADLAIAYDGSTVMSDPVSTPEPGTLALLGGGLAGLALFSRRRHRAH